MAAPSIPPIRLGLIGTGLAVEKPHCPALRELGDRCVVTAFTDSSAEQCRRFADHSGGRPSPGRVPHITQIRLHFRGIDNGYRDPVLGPVPLWRPRGSTGLFDGLSGQGISSSAFFVA
jgi:predicted dehydrogenase